MKQFQRKSSILNIVLWIFQILQASLFLNAGYLKTFRPIIEIAPTIFWTPRFPEAFVRFIGICELLGALGLILRLR
jgi:putative oxidoreductase